MRKQAREAPPGAAVAFTLVELLVVLAIVAALAGIILPVVTAAKRRAQEIPCTTNLRNQWVALSLYCDDRGSGWVHAPLYLSEIRPYLRCDEVFLCLADPRPRGLPLYPLVIQSLPSVKNEILVPYQVSYVYARQCRPLNAELTWMRFLRSHPRIGVVACLWHGGKCFEFPPWIDPYPVPVYVGRVLRVRTDGTVEAGPGIARERCGFNIGEVFLRGGRE
ncbi:MAG: type II secretion system protein [Fimbriimonadia bacterium]